jgi:hypothetical protein
VLHNNPFIVNLYHGKQCKLYYHFFERIYIPDNLHSFHTLHINSALKQKNDVCSWSSTDGQFGAKQIVMTNKSLCGIFNLCPKTFYDIRQNQPIMMQQVLNLTIVCLYSSLSYPACKPHLCAMLCCHLWPVWIYHIFPHYHINGRIFEGK